MIYMDNAATSFPKPPEVIAAVTAALAAPASPGRSSHAASLAAARIIHKARKNLAQLFGLANNIHLALGTNITWALNQALSGLDFKAGDHIISSSLEHNSVARPLNRLVTEKGLLWETAPTDGQGLTTPDDFKKMLRPSTRLVVLNHASNVTGALIPAQAIKAVIGEVPLLLDTAQTAGVFDLANAGQWVDLLAFTGHKGLLGPTGTGGLWVGSNLTLRPLIVGGTGSASKNLTAPNFLPDSLEAGTPNTHGLAGLAAATEILLKKGVKNIHRHEMNLTSIFLDGLTQIPGATIWGPLNLANRLAVVAVTLRGWSSSDLSAALEKKAGILTRAGLQCAPLTHRTMGTLKTGGVTRFSFGLFNTAKEIDIALKTLDQLAQTKH